MGNHVVSLKYCDEHVSAKSQLGQTGTEHVTWDSSHHLRVRRNPFEVKRKEEHQRCTLATPSEEQFDRTRGLRPQCRRMTTWPLRAAGQKSVECRRFQVINDEQESDQM